MIILENQADRKQTETAETYYPAACIWVYHRFLDYIRSDGFA